MNVPDELMKAGRNALAQHLGQINYRHIPTLEEQVHAVLAAVLERHEAMVRQDERERNAKHEALISELIEKPTERERILLAAQLTDEDRAWIESMVETADLLWLANQGAPPLEDDPVAMRLGLVPQAAEAGHVTKSTKRRLERGERLAAARAEVEREVLDDIESRLYRAFVAADEDNTDLNAMTVPELTSMIMRALRGDAE